LDEPVSLSVGQLQLLDLHEDEKNLYLVLELAAGGDLFDKIVGDGGFSEETACQFFNQIVNGLEYCHDKNIVHRDLKPENLLLGREDMLKISDFGLSNSLLDTETLLNTHCGSEKYAAPEIMGSSAAYLGPPTDIWSAGVILYIMTAGAFPFTEATTRCELFVSLMQGNFQFPPKMSPELKDLLLRMWAIEPKQRTTIEEIRRHPWFNLNNPLPQPMELSAMDDELIYRDLAPDVMSHEEMVFDDYEV
jgi:serine/threonine protein kinase